MADLKPTTVGLSISMPLIATLAVALRFHARLTKRIGLKCDDYLALAALLFCYGLSAISLSSVFLGNLGGHLVLSPDNIPNNVEEFTIFQQTLWVLSVISIPATGITKLSVLFFYKRIFVSRSFSVVVWTGIGLIIMWNIAFFLINLLDCLPFELNWHAYAGVSGKCIDIEKIFWAVNISDILTDALILAIPWPQIWGLQMSTIRKFQVCGIFMLGSFVVGAGIARTVLSAPGATSSASNLDYTYSRAPAVYWLVVEANIAVVSACLPTINPLLASPSLRSISSSLQKALSWRSKSSRTTLERIPSDNSPHLVHRKAYQEPYSSYTAVESMPMSTPQHPIYGLEVRKEFHRTDETL